MKQLTFVVALLLLAITSVGAEVIRVPAEQPTIQLGIDAASPGDTVLVAPGTYFESLTIATPILLMSELGADSTIINGTGIKTDEVINILTECTVRGFTLLDDDFSTFGFDCNTNAPTIEFNKIIGMSFSGIFLRSNSPLIRFNLIDSNAQSGIIMNSEATPLIVNNTIVNNQTGIAAFVNSEPVVTNNIIVANGDGIRAQTESTFDNSYNDIWNNAKDYVGGTPGVGDISVDPEFVGGEPADYHLRFSSPCIDAGDPDGAPDPDGSRADIGAFPFRPSGPRLTLQPPDTLDFGDGFVGFEKIKILRISNTGGGVLKLWDFAVDATEFSLKNAPNDTLTVAQSETFDLEVGFLPTMTTLFQGQLTFAGNDTTRPAGIVTLLGAGLSPPEISVSPTQLSADLITGANETKILTISNTGEGELHVDIAEDENDGVAATALQPPYRRHLSPSRPGETTVDAEILRRETYAKRSAADDMQRGEFFAGPFNIPGGIAFDRQGTLFVVNLLSNSIVKVNRNGAITTFATGFTFGNTFASPGLAFSEAGDLFVANSGDGSIKVVSPTGVVSNFVSGLGSPVALQFDRDGNLFVGEQIENNVLVISPDAEVDTLLRALPNIPAAMAVNSSGTFFLALFGEGRVLRVGSDGSTTTFLSVQGFAEGIAFDTQNRLYVADGFQQTIAIYDSSGAFVESLSSGEISGPTSLAFGFEQDGIGNNNLIAASQFTNRALIFRNLDYPGLPPTRFGVTWLREAPVSAVVPPGGDVDISVTFDALELPGGTFTADLVVRSNDPDEPSTRIPATLDVTAAPDIEVRADTLIFGEAFVDFGDSLALTIRNRGSEALEISSIASDVPAFSSSQTALDLSPGDEVTVQIRFVPPTEGIFSGNLTITSNDPDESNVSIFVSGSGLNPPIATVMPTDFDISLDAGQLVERTLTIRNDGASDLNYALTLEFGPQPMAQKAPLAENTTTARVEPYPLQSLLGKDAIAERYDWPTLTQTAKSTPEDNLFRLLVSDPDEEAIQFDVDEIFVAIRGHELLFKVTTNQPWNGPGGQGVAGIFIDVDQDAGTGVDGGRGWGLGVDYSAIRSGGVTNDGFFEWDDEEQDFVFIDSLTTSIIEPNSNEFILGFDLNLLPADDAINIGILGGSFIDRELDVIPDEGTGNVTLFLTPTFLRLSPKSGVVAAGGLAEVSMVFDAQPLNGGEYDARIELASNDPANEVAEIPAHLNVTGVPDIAVQPDTLNFEAVFVETETTLPFTVANEGSDELSISGVVTSTPFSTTDLAFDLRPGEARTLEATFAPQDTGRFEATIQISSNDADDPQAGLHVIGHGVLPPAILVTPSALDTSLVVGALAQKALTIENAGFSDLDYSVSFRSRELSNGSAFVPPPSVDAATKVVRGWQPPAIGIPHGRHSPELEDFPTDLPVVVQDPAGDGNPVDVTALRGAVRQEQLFVQIDFATTINVNDFSGFLSLDLDQDQDTGLPPSSGLPEQDIGAELEFLFFIIEDSLVALFDVESLILIDFYPAAVSQKSLAFAAPLVDLNNDDGNIDVTGVLGTNIEGTDWFPDAGHGTFGKGFAATAPAAGSVAAGQSQLLAVTFDATGLAGGSFESDMVISSNDPALPEVIVPLSLTVIDAPDIAVVPDSLSFADRFLGETHTLPLGIFNRGTEDLEISNISVSDTAFGVEPSTLAVAPTSSDSVIVFVQANAAGNFSATITLVSNDPDEAQIEIPVTVLLVEPVTAPLLQVTMGAPTQDVGSSIGCSWVDFDGDDLPDLLASNGLTAEANFLYRNSGAALERTTHDFITTDTDHSRGVSWGDYDNDGDPDLFVCNFDENNALYRNDGGDAFTRIPSGSIVSDGGRSWSAAWADYDNDGWLDIFVTNIAELNFLYRNDGDGTFTRIADGDIVNDFGVSYTSAWADYDNDGWVDLFVANGDGANFLYHNDQDGTFSRVTTGAIAIDPGVSVGASWGDYNNDGWLDLFVANAQQSVDYLYRNDGDGTFTRIVTGSIVTTPGESYGSGWADVENDGDLDIFVATLTGADLMYLNNSNGTFTRVTGGAAVNTSGQSLGSAWGDYNRDGYLDLFVANQVGENLLFENLGGEANWVEIRLRGVASNRSAIGAKVHVLAALPDLPHWLMREIAGHSGTLSQGSLSANFGIGSATIVDSLVIEWPSGMVQRFADLEPNRTYKIAEDDSLVTGVDNPVAVLPASFGLSQNFPNPFNPETRIRFQLPQANRVELRIYNLRGEHLRTLLDEELPAGEHSLQWDGRDAVGRQVASGVYFYRLRAGTFEQVRKMTLLR